MRNLPGRSFGMSGFLADMAAHHELVPLVWTSGGAGGYVTSEAYERIVGADPAWNTPEQMLQVAKKDAEVIEKIVRTANIKVD